MESLRSNNKDVPGMVWVARLISVPFIIASFLISPVIHGLYLGWKASQQAVLDDFDLKGI